MAINKSFGGANINIPGSYSTSTVDNSGGGALVSNDTIMLVGESTKGAPGTEEGIQEFTNAQLNTLISKYGSGPLVDCALAASRPSKTPGIGGAGRYLIWKTNLTTQASLDIKEATDSDRLFVIKDQEWGQGGNDLHVTIATGTSGLKKLVTVKKLNDTSESLGENDALVCMNIQYTGDASTASAAISGASQISKLLVVTLAGNQTDGSLDLSINLKDYSIKALVDFINLQTGYSASLVTNQYAAKKAYEMDSIGATNIKASVSLYRLQLEILDVINASARVLVELDVTPQVGLPINITDVFLSSGAQGASINSDFSTGLSKSLAEDYNVVLACVSRDAADDIADVLDGFTDTSSTYDIASVLIAVESHMRVRDTVEALREALAMGGIRDAVKQNVYDQAATLSSELFQLCFLDVKIQDQFSNLVWKHPHVYAAQCAGIRLGTEVGEPLTHKRLNALGVGHFVNSETGIASGDFVVDLDKKTAVEAGVLFSEKIGSIFRIIVDNTTYGADDSFVYNRGSVMEAAQYVARDLRQVGESAFVGKKLPAKGAAKSIKNVLRNRLIELNAPDVNIITSSNDAPQGFVEETFVVELNGSAASVQIQFKPVQGLDWIFLSFSLGNITQSA